jgi:hypothetical protein
MSNEIKKVDSAQGAESTGNQETKTSEQIADEVAAAEAAKKAATAETKKADKKKPVTADVASVEVSSEWGKAQETANLIFEQYADKSEVWITVEGQGFWTEAQALSDHPKYRKFER